MARICITEKQKENARLSHNLEMVMGGRSVREMCAVLQWSTTKFTRVMNEPCKMTLEQAKQICKLFNADFVTFTTGLLTGIK